MFGLDPTQLAFIGLTGFAACAIVYTFMFDKISNENRQDKRLKSVQSRQDTKTRKVSEARVQDATKRRSNIQKTMKELDRQSKKENTRVPLAQQFSQAGLNITMQHFILLSILSAIIGGILGFIGSGNPFTAGAVFLVCGLGLPRWIVGRLKARRMKAFLAEFPNAVDVIVRGVKAGLPLNDCLGIISRESKEPVAGEFKKIIDSQQMGLTVGEAVGKLYKNVPLTEANFFGIVISIQASAGGNLSEALNNLSVVLRDRKKMKAKISAMSAEAKASGIIIGALPLIVMALVYATTPDYIAVLFTHSTGNLILLGSGTWMLMGVMVMKNMINFDF